MSIRYDTSEALDATAEERVRHALEQIEGAQNLLSAAAVNLSPVIGLVPEWKRVMKLHHDVKRHWYRLDEKLRARAGKLRLDAVNEAARQKRLDDAGSEAPPVGGLR
jgi:hypothetical protein